MSGDLAKPGRTGPGPAKEKEPPRNEPSLRQPATDASRAVVPDVVVEEIFLEGDSMTMLRHEAGSTRTMGLLESADVLDPAVRQSK